MFVLYPVLHSNISLGSHLNYCRRIEDRLMFYKLDIATEISIHYDIKEMHGNDTRHMSSRARLCVSQTVHSSTCHKLSNTAPPRVEHGAPPVIC